MDCLQNLLTEAFRVKLGLGSSPRLMRLGLQRMDEVKQIRKDLQSGLISEASIERFSNDLMEQFQRGIQFPYEHVFAAIAVALETRATKFAEDYLLDLARLVKISEMDIGPRVAGECLKERSRTPKYTRKNIRNRFASQFKKMGQMRIRKLS